MGFSEPEGFDTLFLNNPFKPLTSTGEPTERLNDGDVAESHILGRVLRLQVLALRRSPGKRHETNGQSDSWMVPPNVQNHHESIIIIFDLHLSLNPRVDDANSFTLGLFFLYNIFFRTLFRRDDEHPCGLGPNAL